VIQYNIITVYILQKEGLGNVPEFTYTIYRDVQSSLTHDLGMFRHT